MVLLAAPARALERDGTAASAAPRDTKWDIAFHGGYGVAFTTGINYLGMGMGGRLGCLVGRHLRISLGGYVTTGAGVSAGTSYRSEYSSVQGSLSFGYEGGVGPLRVRPGMCGGAALITGHTRVGTTVIHDDTLAPFFGPCAEVVARVGPFEVGAGVEAAFVPTWPASPTIATHAIVGVVF